MPQLIFKGVKKEDVCNFSKDMAQSLSEISDTPIDYFTFERPETNYFSNNSSFEMYPLIEVIQFDRGSEVEEKMAKQIATIVKSCGYKECEVYFTHIDKKDYYEF